jgi:hypothetical protein
MSPQDKIKLSKLLIECMKIDTEDKYFRKRFDELNQFILDENPPTQKTLNIFYQTLSKLTNDIILKKDYWYVYEWREILIQLMPKDLYNKKIYILQNLQKNELAPIISSMINLEIKKILIDNIDLMVIDQEKEYDFKYRIL